MKQTGLGLVKTTLIDFPGEVAAAVFLPGCNLRCPFCHNPSMTSPPYPDDLFGYDEVRSFLVARAHLLGGVCISGGEPLIHDDLYDFVYFCKELGLKVKLDTNGTLPDRLDPAIFDYIAMDIKTRPEKYHLLTGKPFSKSTDPGELSERIYSSIRKISDSDVQHEFRTTVVPGIVEESDVEYIADLLGGSIGSNCRGTYVLAQFRPKVTLNRTYENITPYSDQMLRTMADTFKSRGIACRIRNQYVTADKR